MGNVPHYVVIPTAVEPRNPSLPYALAAIRKHTTYTPVTVGHDTGLCELHIPTRQQPGRAHVFENTDLAIRTACETDWISDSWILSADDIYWLHPAEPVRWALGNLDDTTGNTVYAQRKRQTAALLHSLGLPTLDYEAHVPITIRKAPALEALHLGGSFRSVYGNLTGRPDLVAPDVKIRSRRDALPSAAWASSEGNPQTWPALAEALLLTG